LRASRQNTSGRVRRKTGRRILARIRKSSRVFTISASCSVGKMSCAQIRALAAIARDLGDGDLRLTV